MISWSNLVIYTINKTVAKQYIILVCSCEKTSMHDLLMMLHCLNINSNTISMIKSGITKNTIIPISKIGFDIIGNCLGLSIKTHNITIKLIIQIMFI